MQNHLVELTPNSWGSPALGFSNTFPFEIRDVEHWAQISSAVVDAPGYDSCRTLRQLGFRFGGYVETPATVTKPIRGQQVIYLADGGFVDNLAARNLVRRGCKSILIVDAEHDPSLMFEGFQRLRNDVAATSGTQRVIVNPIENWLELRGKDQCPRNAPCFQADNHSNPIVREPLIEGCISTSGLCDKPEDVLTRIFYLKLSIDPVAVRNGRLPTHVASFYRESSESKICKDKQRGKNMGCSFPHTSTFKLNYTSDEFRAYRLLAEDMIKQHLDRRRFLLKPAISRK